MTLELSTISSLITQFGFPLAFLIIVLWTGARGDWLYGAWVTRLITQMTASYEAAIAQRDKRIADLEQEKNEWKAIALQGSSLAKNLALRGTQDGS